MSDHKERTNEETEIEFEQETEQSTPDDIDLADTETLAADKVTALRKKLTECTEEKRVALEDLQRARADFLNSRRRIEAEKVQQKTTILNQHIEELLPLCDSFVMAMSDTDRWQSIDETWRKGVEGIYAQLKRILDSYQVTMVSPLGEPFDPNRHEAMGNTPVTDQKAHDTVVSVVQPGFIRTVDGQELVIRPARVMVGQFES